MDDLSFPERLRAYAAAGGEMKISLTANQAKVLADHLERKEELAALVERTRVGIANDHANAQRYERIYEFWIWVMAYASSMTAALAAARVLRELFG